MNFLQSISWVWLLICLGGGITLNAQADQNARDLQTLTSWFEGEFDNDSQMWFEARRSWDGNPEEKHKRVHIIHAKIPNSSLGNHAFYVEEFYDEDTLKIERQRVVVFESMAPSPGIKMAIWFLKDQKKYQRAFKRPELLKNIGVDDLATLEGCDVIFQRMGEQYHGSMIAKACQFGEGVLKRYAVHNMIISKNQYWRIDRSFLVKDDSFYKGHPNEIPYKMRKAKHYSCDIAFYEKAYYIPSEKDKKFNQVLIHNQGGKQWFDNPLNGKRYAIQLREKEYPFYADGSDFFMLRFIEEGKLASELIVTAEPGVEKISFSMGWASCNCKLLQ